MGLRVVGAGLGRTGTKSLKTALERLLGGTCHHMMEVFQRPEQVPVWTAASEGTMPDWHALMADFTASCDWPSAAFWPELSAAFPDALVVLSTRDPDAWYRSANATIFVPIRAALATPPGTDPWSDMARALFTHRFCAEVDDEALMKQRFVEHNERVRREVDPDRLLVWEASHGWEPLCRALALPVPDEPFPLTNTTEEFQEMMGVRPD